MSSKKIENRIKKNTEINSGIIRELQEHIAEKIKDRGFEDETLHERLILLMEEMGELAKACRKISRMNSNQNKKNNFQVGEEVADIINLIFAVGIKLDLDIEKEFIKKNKKVDKRIYRRSK